MATKQFTSQNIVDLAALVKVGESLVEMLNDSKKVKSFLIETDKITEVVEQAKSVEKNKIETLNAVAVNKKLLEKISIAQNTLNDTQAKLQIQEAEFKAKRTEFEKNLENYIQLKAELDKQVSIVTLEKEAVIVARKAAEDELSAHKQKNTELDAKTSEINAKLSKLKEI